MADSIDSITRHVPKKFLVAFSFAGEQRDKVRAIAESLEQHLGYGTVFFDEWFPEHLATLNTSDLKLQKIYLNSEIVVVCASSEYASKNWTLTEWDAIRSSNLTHRAKADIEADIEDASRIMPIGFGNFKLDGLLENTIWLDGIKSSENYIARIITERLQRFLPSAGRPHVFLAETTPDLDDPKNPVSRSRLKVFLEDECNALVLPEQKISQLEPSEYPDALHSSMLNCIVFVQLLSRYPWTPLKYDVKQFESAKSNGCEIYRFRGEIDLSDVKESDADHYSFLIENEPITGSFEMFKEDLKQKISSATEDWMKSTKERQRLEKEFRTGTKQEDNEVPFIVVSIRAKQEELIWDQVYNYLENKNIHYDMLQRNEEFASLEQCSNSDGFMILCDRESTSNEQLSPHQDLRDCRKIQLDRRNDPQKPPTVLVYWPPPEDVPWSKLVKNRPPALHKVLGGESLAKDLEQFTREVRDVRSSRS